MSEANENEQQSQKSGSSKVLIIILSLVILLLAVGATWAIASGKVDFEEMMKEPPPPPVVMLEEPVFKPMDKFVVSIANGYSRNYMVLEITLVSKHPDMESQVHNLSSLMKNTLLKHFSAMDMEQVNNKLGNLSQLQIDLRHAFIDAAEAYGQTLPIEEVLLTNVVIQ